MDDLDKLPSFDAGEAPRRSTSSLGPLETLGELGHLDLQVLTNLRFGGGNL